MPSVTIQPDTTVGEDTRLRQAVPAANYGNDTTVKLARDAGARFASLIRFRIPREVKNTISACRLTLNLSTVVGGTANFTIARCVHEWVESQATWTIYSTGNNWSGGTPEFSANYDATLAVQGVLPSVTGFYECPDLTALAYDAIANRSRRLSLMLLPEPGNAAQAWTIRSSAGVASKRPKLAISYATGGVSMWGARGQGVT